MNSFTSIEREGVPIATRRVINLRNGLVPNDQGEVDKIHVGVALPRVKYGNDSQSLTNNAYTTLNYDVILYDYAPGEVTSTAPFTYTVKHPGVYTVKASLLLASTSLSAGTIYQLAVNVNGVLSKALDRHTMEATTTELMFLAGSEDFAMARGDYFTVSCFQNSGGAINVYSSADYYVYNTVTISYLGISQVI